MEPAKSGKLWLEVDATKVSRCELRLMRYCVTDPPFPLLSAHHDDDGNAYEFDKAAYSAQGSYRLVRHGCSW
jgi:hypothetical protein